MARTTLKWYFLTFQRHLCNYFDTAISQTSAIKFTEMDPTKIWRSLRELRRRRSGDGKRAILPDRIHLAWRMGSTWPMRSIDSRKKDRWALSQLTQICLHTKTCPIHGKVNTEFFCCVLTSWGRNSCFWKNLEEPGEPLVHHFWSNFLRVLGAPVFCLVFYYWKTWKESGGSPTT